VGGLVTVYKENMLDRMSGTCTVYRRKLEARHVERGGGVPVVSGRGVLFPRFSGGYASAKRLTGLYGPKHEYRSAAQSRQRQGAANGHPRREMKSTQEYRAEDNGRGREREQALPGP
jgi:hypothetical protein